MLKIGTSSIFCPFDRENLTELKRAGITDLELSFTLRECESVSPRSAVSLAKECGIAVTSYHLPFSSPSVLELAAENGEIRRRTTALYCKLIKEYCDSKLERFSRPSSVTILDALPKTRMAKIDFMKLTDMPPAPQATRKEIREERKAKREIEKAAEKAGREAEKQEKEEREAAEKAKDSIASTEVNNGRNE